MTESELPTEEVYAEEGESTAGQAMALDIIQRMLERFEKANDNLDRRAVNLVSISGAIGGLAGGVNLIPGVQMVTAQALLVGFVAFLGALVVFQAARMLSSDLKEVPGCDDNLQLHRRYISAPERVAQNRRISSTVHCTKIARSVNDTKSVQLERMLIYLHLQLIALFVSAAWVPVSAWF